MTKQTLVLLFGCVSGLSSTVWANVSSHVFSDSARKLVLSTATTQWDFFENGEDAANANRDLELQFVARSPEIIRDSIQPTLTMRIDKGDWPSSRSYAEKWLKEYPKFGYELLMSRQSFFGQLGGFEMELRSDGSNRRVRQFIVKREHEMWVFTCSSDTDHFAATWKACDKILRTAKMH